MCIYKYTLVHNHRQVNKYSLVYRAIHKYTQVYIGIEVYIGIREYK